MKVEVTKQSKPYIGILQDRDERYCKSCRRYLRVVGPYCLDCDHLKSDREEKSNTPKR